MYWYRASFELDYPSVAVDFESWDQAIRLSSTVHYEDFQSLPLRYRELYLRFQKELDLCREAMIPHLEYRRRPAVRI